MTTHDLSHTSGESGLRLVSLFKAFRKDRQKPFSFIAAHGGLGEGFRPNNTHLCNSFLTGLMRVGACSQVWRAAAGTSHDQAACSCRQSDGLCAVLVSADANGFIPCVRVEPFDVNQPEELDAHQGQSAGQQCQGVCPSWHQEGWCVPKCTPLSTNAGERLPPLDRLAWHASLSHLAKTAFSINLKISVDSLTNQSTSFTK